ncbi:MAG: hypothetical protein VBE63_11895 [Lamprobacter sp.]|uniref:type II toxin-antitoxin system RelE family toxin n=1 Tax=Lamprobacter sp. TaxID=3100796 RepID=UPI002B263E0C|nr:hypothetical protein [Lamprobacter sp.]MEA3640630.1 hypothetical protein [Lamprobacter sp.]
MPWQIALKPRAKRELAKLDRPVQQRLVAFMERLTEHDDPRELGRALQGPHQLYRLTRAERWTTAQGPA